MAGKTYEETLGCTCRRAYAAAVSACADLGYSVVATNADAGVLSFNTGRSFKTWAGQDMTATVLDAGSGNTRIVLGGTIATRGRLGGNQVTSWGEKKAVAMKFLERVRVVLPSIAEPAIAGSTQTIDVADQLERLLKLRDQGVLTEEEWLFAFQRGVMVASRSQFGLPA